jgi:hypothetical protein
MIDLAGLLIVINFFLNLVTNYKELVLKVLRKRAGMFMSRQSDHILYLRSTRMYLYGGTPSPVEILKSAFSI